MPQIRDFINLPHEIHTISRAKPGNQTAILFDNLAVSRCFCGFSAHEALVLYNSPVPDFRLFFACDDFVLGPIRWLELANNFCEIGFFAAFSAF